MKGTPPSAVPSNVAVVIRKPKATAFGSIGTDERDREKPVNVNLSLFIYFNCMSDGDYCEWRPVFFFELCVAKQQPEEEEEQQEE